MNPKSKLAAGAFAAVATLLFAAGCGGSDSDGGSTSSAGNEKAPSELINAGTMKVCMALSYPPMEYYKNGTSGDIVGFDADSARALGDLWGVKTEFTAMDFDGLVPGVDANRCDVLWSALYMSPERLEVLNGAPYVSTGPAILVKSGDEGDYTQQSDLCGKKFAVQSGGSMVDTLKGFSKDCTSAGNDEIEISQYPQPSEAIAAVRNGKVDALLETDVTIADIVKNNDDLAKTDDFLEAETQFGAFTSKKKQELSEAVAAGIKELAADGTLGEIADQYGLSQDKVVTSS